VTAPLADTGRWDDAHRAREQALLAERAALPADDPRQAALRDELVTLHLPLVRHLARRYAHRGEPFDDLVQVGTEGLIKAVDRYDPARGTSLSSLAVPTIVGEIKRHFRDRTWAAHVPRRLQELYVRVSRETDTLTAALGRTPTVRELSAALDVPEHDVLEAMGARHAYAADPLESPAGGVADLVGAEDAALATVEDRQALLPALQALPPHEQHVVVRRFFHERTQSDIAEELGVSQMQVSRLLARALDRLRGHLAPSAA
jgi:RNA polymerase sigma-B factor